MKTKGQIGYEAYAVATGGKTWDGKPMPTWEAVVASGTKVAAAWEAAAQAILASEQPMQPHKICRMVDGRCTICGDEE